MVKYTDYETGLVYTLEELEALWLVNHEDESFEDFVGTFDVVDVLESKDGYEVEVGMWLSDITGTYEVKSINSYDVTLQEILWEEDSDNYDYGDYRHLTFREVEHLAYIV